MIVNYKNYSILKVKIGNKNYFFNQRNSQAYQNRTEKGDLKKKTFSYVPDRERG